MKLIFNFIFIIFIIVFLNISYANSDTIDAGKCYNNNIKIGDLKYEKKEYSISMSYYKKANECAESKKQKIRSLASLATVANKKNNLKLSKKYLESLLLISPNNKWVEEFTKNNNIELSPAENSTDKIVLSDEKSPSKEFMNSSFAASHNMGVVHVSDNFNKFIKNSKKGKWEKINSNTWIYHIIKKDVLTSFRQKTDLLFIKKGKDVILSRVVANGIELSRFEVYSLAVTLGS